MIASVIATISDWYCIRLTEAQVEAILASDPYLAADLKKYGRLDTSGREMFMGAIDRYVGVKGHWPTYGDASSYALAYWLALKEKLDGAGFKTTEGFKYLVQAV